MAKPVQQQLRHPHGQQLIATRTQYSGIIPNAEEMERYESIHAGAFDRLLGLAELQTNHRISMEVKQKDLESKAVQASAENMRQRNLHIGRGQWIAFALCVGALAVAYEFLINNSPGADATIATAAFAQLAAAFIFAPRANPERPGNG